MLKERQVGFTLLEIIIVVIIIGVLASISVPNFLRTRESALDREAIANLRLIAAAERARRMETGRYYASANPHIQNINNNLRLFLSAGANRSWNYRTWADNTATPPTFCAQATRNVTGGRTWRLRNTEDDPVTGTCP